jgi:putative redox protein
MSCGLSHTHANALGRFSSRDTIERHLTRLYEYLKGVRGTMVTAEIRQVSDTTFIARGDTNHWVVMDDQTHFGGSEAASDPMEVLLFSLGGCMGMWLDVLIKKMSIPVERILLSIRGERAKEDPQMYTRIHVGCHFHGETLDHHELEKVLSRVKEKHSAVYRMIQSVVPIETEIEIHQDRPE